MHQFSSLYQIDSSGIFSPSSESIKIIQDSERNTKLPLLDKRTTMKLRDDAIGDTVYIDHDKDTLAKDIQILKTIASKKNEMAQATFSPPFQSRKGSKSNF